MNLFMAISGGSSTQLIERDIRAALVDPSVEQIIQIVDSPGGTVDGTFELSDFVYANRETKPVITLASGSMYSAAYGIGSSAKKVFLSSLAAGAGSIGVVAAHEDWSKAEERMGVKTTEIYAGKYKRAASQYRPLDEEGKKSIQDEVDHLYSVFVDAVARNRGVSSEEVLGRMSTDVKSAFIGSQAIEAGLVDGVATLNDLIERRVDVGRRVQVVVAAGLSLRKSTAQAGASAAETEEAIMNLAELKEKHPDIYAAARAEGAESMECPEKCKEESKKEGAAAERERIQGVMVLGDKMSGHAELVKALAFDGKTTSAEAAIALVNAEGDKKAKVLGDIKTSAPAIVPSPAAPAIEAPAAAEDKSLPVEERAKAKWDADADIRTEFRSDYAAYLSWYRAEDDGRVRRQKKSDRK